MRLRDVFGGNSGMSLGRDKLSYDPNTSFRLSNVKSWNEETHPEGVNNSTWVNDIKYDAGSQQLVVTFRDGFRAQYDGITPTEAEDFRLASSKGRWVRNNLVGRAYTGV